MTVPLYWFLLLPAAIMAIADLILSPHKWNKTGHGVAERESNAQPRPFPIRDPQTGTGQLDPARP
jgi:hypothetical protein